MIIYDYDPKKIPPPYLRALGYLSLCAPQTNDVLQKFVHSCLGVDMEYGIATTTHMSVPLLVDVAKSSSELRLDSPAAIDEAHALIDQCKDALDKRNKYLHSPLCKHPVTGEIFISLQQARGSIRLELVPVSSSEIRNDADVVLAAGLSLFAFMGTNGLKPSVPPFRPRAHKTPAARKAVRKATGKPK